MEAVMAVSAPVTQFRNETVKGFEVDEALLRMTATTEAVIKGNTATFLVADSGSATATTRGVNGLIPARNNNLTQTSATLVEKNDLVEMTNFNIFQSQGDQRKIMQDTSRGVINRDIDQVLITVLNTGTLDTGAVQPASLGMALRAKTILGNNKVPFDGNIFAAITPAFEAYLLQVAEFSSADYVAVKPMADATLAWRDAPMMYRWLGVNWIVHPELPGVGTAAEKCFMYHYEEKQNISWARTTVYHGAALLQNAGVVVLNHDGSSSAAE
jgi:hypothetical protein